MMNNDLENDPAKRIKLELAERAQEIFLELSALSKSLARGSDSHEEMTRALKNFVSNESNIDTTAHIIRENMQTKIKDQRSLSFQLTYNMEKIGETKQLLTQILQYTEEYADRGSGQPRQSN
eukprot:TRINITY_DN4034_c0_g1_i1.p1 TRINITY_DN4034_c0_g1~~TRINITY_DN4034_c0_g1_i1.p1  ORF type:complete len:135 (-),score=35.67 TRINITY_DN4034_c0_g1_i1:62-427(-)